MNQPVPRKRGSTSPGTLPWGSRLRMLFLFVLGVCSTQLGYSAIFTVSNNANTGAGSLRQAITNVNAAGAGPHSIVFTYAGVINVPASLPAITNANVTVDGGGTVTISGPGADNTVYLFTIGAGANNTVIRGFTMQNTGVEPVKITGNVSGVILENMTWRQTSTNYMNHGLYVTGAVTNITIRNINITQVQDKFWGLRFANTVNGVMINNVRITTGAGLTARGIQFEKAATNVTVKNSVIDMDDPATADDGDYGILFSSTVNGFTMDSTIVRDAETYGVYFTGSATNVTIKNSTFDNLDGSGAVQLLRFNGNGTNITVDRCTFNGDLRNVVDDGNIGLTLEGNYQQVTVTNNTFIENDANGMYVGIAGGCNHDGFLIQNNTFTKNGYGSDAQGGLRFYARNLTSDVDSVRILDNTFIDNNGEGIGVYPGNTTTYVLPKFVIRGNTVRNTKTVYGGINVQYVDRVIITKNSIYNNQGPGIELTAEGNCNYEGTNKPKLVGSTPVSANTYNLTITLPPICAAGCNVEVFANDPGVTGIGGQHYVTTLTGVPNGTTTHSITSNLPAATAAPYGTWTANLRIPANNCGTSEFSNKMAIRLNGPAGIDAGIQLWMNPDITDAGNMVNGAGWEDFSGNNRHFDMVAGAPARIDGGLNYNHFIRFDGNDWMRSTSSPFVNTNTAGEVFTVTKTPTAATTNGNPYDFGSNSRGSHYRWSNDAIYNGFGTNKRFAWNPATKAIVEAKPGVSVVSGNAVDVSKWNLYGTHSATNSWGVYFNGQQIITSNTNVVSFALTAGNEYVGAVSGGPFNGDIAEEILYNRRLNTGERQRVNTYLGVKYGLTLNHNYIASDSTVIWWNQATNTGYNNDIAGLAKDQLSVLDQKQSKSVNDDDVVSAALGDGFFTSVFDNPNETGNDLSAFMWGNNNLATTFTVAYPTAYSDTRMARVWKVQKTGWQDTTIIIRLENSVENRTLLISNDPTFATVTGNYPLNDSGCVILNTNQFANGSYFTFANRVIGPGCVTTGIKAWYKASGYQTATGAWIDNSGNSNHAAGTANYPRRLHNYNRAIDFNGLNMEYMPAIYPGGSYPFEMFIVDLGTGPIFAKDITGNNCDAGPIYYGQGQMTITIATGNHNTIGTALPAAVTNIPHINNAVRTAGGATSLFVNHAGNGTGTFVQMGGVYGQPHFGGRNDYGCSYLPQTMEIPEAIFFGAPLTAAQRLRVNSYLAIKYGITLSQATPTNYVASNGTTLMWTAADNTGYNFNITGIGKDMCTNLEQKQSRSVNAQGTVAIALGNEVATENLTNTYAVTNDLSFFMFADNNGSKTFSTPLTGTTATLRMQRVWKVDKTNWVDQDITLKYIGNATNAYLLISNASGTFATVDQEFAVNADSTITFNSSLLPDGAFFTFGKEIKGPGGVARGIAAWWRGDYGLTPAMWEDYSGYGIDVPQNNAALQPLTGTSLVNFNPTPSFTGTQYYGLGNVVDAPSSALGNGNMNNVAIFGVSVPNNATAYGALFAQMTTNGYYIEAAPTYGALASSTTYWDAPYGWRLNAASGAVAGKANVWSFTKTVPSMEYYRDHQMIQQSVATRDFTTNHGANNASNIGQWNGSASTFNGNMPEVVVYKDITTMTATDRLKIESYLALKYGVSLYQTPATDYLATDGSAYWSAAGNVGYNTRITGIGRDDKTDLNQKQSRNQDAGAIVTIGLGDAIMTDNASNTNMMEDLSFLTWADNNANTNFGAAVTSVPNATVRMNRVWKVDKTANWADQNITLRVDQNGDRYILINPTDPTFGVGTVEYTLDVNTGSVTFNSADLPDGAYFTVASRISGPACVNAGIRMWLRADYSATGAGWSDFSGNQISATQATPANQPTVSPVSVNFNPGLTFNGTTSWMGTPALNASDYVANSYFVVNKPNTVSGFRDYLSGAASAASVFEFRQDNNLFEYGEANAATFVLGPAGSVVANTPLISSTTQVAGTNGVRLFKNGTLLTTGTVNLTHPNAPATLEMGRRHGTYSAALYYSGQMLEAIAYNRVLSAMELQKVNSYLSLKYGLTMNSGVDDYVASNWNGTTGTKMWTSADNTGFKNRITGIGRDNCTDLHQKQSLNQEGGTVTISTGTVIAASNVLNVDTVITDDSYLMFADNNAPGEYLRDVAGSNVTQRLARTWKVDKTNWADQYITFKNAYGGTDVYLLINATDSSFATLDQEIAVAVDSTVSFNSSLLPDGAYFTFGKRIKGPACVNSGIRIWLDANDGLTAIVNGVQWDDKSGNDLNVAQTTDAREADPGTANMAHNFNAFVDFDGDDVFETDKQVLRSATSSGTVFFVSKYRDLAGYDSPVDFDADDPHIGRLNASSGIYKNGSTPISYFPGGNMTITQDKTQLSGYAWTGGTNGGVELRLDAASAIDNTMDFNAIGYTQDFGVGAYISGAEGINGTMAEVIVYGKRLSAAEINKVESYLGLKYGISLNQTVPTDYTSSNSGVLMWQASANVGYTGNIAGLGRDDCGGLYQKQSRSANAAPVITVGLGNSIEATNADNTGTIDNDLSFLTWSDNNLATTFGTPVTGVANATVRMTRVWKVDKTNWVDGNITIRVDQNGDRYLLVNASDPTFGAGTVEYALNTTTGELVINTADLPDGAYFTVASRIVGPGCVNTGLKTWLRSDYGVTSYSAGKVKTWADYSGNQNTFSQADSTKSPIYGAVNPYTNFQPYVYFNNVANNQFLGAATNLWTTGQAGTGIAVAFNQTVTGSYAHLIDQNDEPSLLKYPTVAKMGVYDPGTSVTGVTAPVLPDLQNNVPAVLGMDFGTTANSYRILQNGLAGTVTSGAPTVLNNAMRIGLQADNTDPWKGAIQEVVIYNRQLTVDELARVNSYMALKHGITLANGSVDYVASDWNGTTGTKMWTAADNTGYGFRITGIGRDDCDGLDQRQSRNREGGQITAALGATIETTNDGNANTAGNNNSYFVFADNNAATTFTLPVSGSIVTQGMQRIWKVDKTNWNDADITLKSSLAGGGDVYLVVSTSPTFATLTAELPMNADSTVLINTFQIPDGAYFTFAKRVIAPGCVGTPTLWMKADSGLVGAPSNITTWTDQSPYARIMTKTGAGTLTVPAQGLNYNAVIDFPGTAWVNIPQFTGTATAGEIFSVQISDQPNSHATYRFPWEMGGTYATGAGYAYTGSHYSYFGSTTRKSFALGTVDVLAPHILNTYSATNDWAVAFDGTQAFSTATNVVNFTPTPTANAVGGGHTAVFDGKISEVILYDRKLSTFERQKLNTYLGVKYGLTVGHDYYSGGGLLMWDRTTGALNATNADEAFSFNVAAIQNESCAAIVQKQSRSSNSANEVIIASGGIKPSNATNGATADFTDGDFLIWGADGNAAYTFNATHEGVANLRLNRLWKIRDHGGVGQIQFAIPKAAIQAAGPLLGECDAYMLLVSNGSANPGTDWNSTNATEYVLSEQPINGVDCYVTNLTFETDSVRYFTIGRLQSKGAVPYLVADNNTTTVLTKCESTDWIYFLDPADDTRRVLSIYKNGNTVDADDFSVTIDATTDQSTPATSSLGKADAAVTGGAVFLMRRLVQVTFTPAPGHAITNPVAVRMYWDDGAVSMDEKQIALDNLNALMTASGITPATPPTFGWFKAGGQDIATTLAGLTADGVNPTPGSQQWSETASGEHVYGTDGAIPYVQFLNVTGFSTFGGLWIANDPEVTPLPVTLLSYTARKEDRKARLDWTTVSEINNDHFQIDKSTDLVTWKPLGTVPGAGNSNLLLNYFLYDHQPVTGVNYYRLTQVDYDGTKTEKGIRSVTFDGGDVTPDWTIQPNPVAEAQKLVTLTNVPADADVTLISPEGKVLFQMNATGPTMTLNIGGLKPGVYFVRVGTGAKTLIIYQ